MAWINFSPYRLLKNGHTIFKMPKLNAEARAEFIKELNEQSALSLRYIMPPTCILHLLALPLASELYPKQFIALLCYHLFVAAGCAILFLMIFSTYAQMHMLNVGLPIWFLTAGAVAITLGVLENGVYYYISAAICWKCLGGGGVEGSGPSNVAFLQSKLGPDPCC
ncbi:hypothetical protein [Methylobacterium nigriterrae]|uniref:hypothetical protein n=1 Tax=Methylobacterium nigriterrae TaxID=3127512 RepID=UPI00301403F9